MRTADKTTEIFLSFDGFWAVLVPNGHKMCVELAKAALAQSQKQALGADTNV